MFTQRSNCIDRLHTGMWKGVSLFVQAENVIYFVIHESLYGEAAAVMENHSLRTHIYVSLNMKPF